MFWRMLADDGRVWLIVAGVLALVAMAVVRFIVRRQDERYERGVATTVTGARVVSPQRGSPPRAAEGASPERTDLRRPGPYAWSAPPAEPYLPTATRDAPTAAFDPKGLSLEEVGSMSYRGAGIEPERHPASQHPTFGADLRSAVCGRCRSHKVLIIDLSWNVHPYSGDAYWDFETRCTECGAFNRHLGAES